MLDMTIRNAAKFIEDAAQIDPDLKVSIVSVGDQVMVNFRDVQTGDLTVAYRELLRIKHELCLS